MIRKILQSQRGSTLMMVLVTMVVLSILGTAIMSVGVMGFKMKVYDRKAKATFYLAEAGLQEAYALIQQQVETAIFRGNDAVRIQLTPFVEDEIAKENGTAPYTVPQDSPMIKPDGTIDEALLKVEMNKWFQQAYRNYLNANLKTILENYSYGNGTSIIDRNILIITLKSSDGTNGFVTDNDYDLTLQSDYLLEGIQKAVAMSFEITIPEYDQPYFIDAQAYNIKNHPLSNKVVTADGNVLVEGGQVTILGDLYAYGKNNGYGIRVDGGNLTVNNGRIVSHKFIETEGNGAQVRFGGNVYCNTLQVPEGAVNSLIQIGDGSNSYRLFTEDDIELNGISSKINVYGSYYGFSYGGDATTTHDQSSAIVINADDIGPGPNDSKLMITGTSPLGSVYPPSGVYIGGTTYIDLSDKFQSGESVAIRGNYLAYTEDILSNITLPSPYDYNDIAFKSYEVPSAGSTAPLILADKLKSRNGGLGGAIQAREKGYLIKSVFDDASMRSILNIGGDGLQINNLLYASGAYFTSGSVGNAYKEYNTYYSTIQDIVKDYKTQTNRFGITTTDDQLDTKTFVQNVFSYPVTPIKFTNPQRGKICYINGNPGESIAIIGGSTSETITVSDRYEFPVGLTQPIEGIIVTEGDVYIAGNIDFQGIIISGGNIYFKDGNTKKITWNKDVTIQLDASAGVDGTSSYRRQPNVISISSWERIR